MFWSISSLIALMSGVFLLTFIYFYLFMYYKERYLLNWALSWLTYSLSYVFAFWYAAHMKSIILIMLNQISMLFSGLFLLLGTYEFIERKTPVFWLYATLPGVIWIGFAIISDFSIRVITFPTYSFLGMIYIWTGHTILNSKNFVGIGKHITAISFSIWGIYKIFLPIIGEESWLTPWGYLLSWLAPWGFLISMVMTFIAAIGILLIFFNKISLDLSKNEERFRLLAENARDIIYRFYIKPNFKMEYMSPASKAILDITPEEIYKKPKQILKYICPRDKYVLKKILKCADVTQENIRWINKSGNIVWIEHKNVPVFDKNKNLIAIEGIARDITERKKAEQILEKYQLLSELAQDIILMMLPDGQIIEANKSAVKAYSYNREKLLELNIKDLYPPENIQDLNSNFFKAQKTGVIFETININQNGTKFPVEVSLQGAFIGEDYRLLSIVRDLTQRKKEELAILEARERLARSEKMASLGIVAAGIAHEINQPLNSLKVTSDSILSLHNKGKSIEATKFIEKIKRISNQAIRIDTIIKNIRSLVKKEQDLSKETSDLNKSINEALSIISPQVNYYGINIKKDFSEVLPRIKVQNMHIEGIVINLVINAMQALKNLKKTEKLIKIKTFSENDYVFIEIIDNGPGIDESIKDKIFEPFFSNSNLSDCTGLGLSIVQTIVNTYNGKVDFENNEWGGTTFRVKLPIHSFK